MSGAPLSDEQKLVYTSAFAAAFVRQILDRHSEGRSDASDDANMDRYAEEAAFIATEAARRLVVPTTLEDS